MRHTAIASHWSRWIYCYDISRTWLESASREKFRIIGRKRSCFMKLEPDNRQRASIGPETPDALSRMLTTNACKKSNDNNNTVKYIVHDHRKPCLVHRDREVYFDLKKKMLLLRYCRLLRSVYCCFRSPILWKGRKLGLFVLDWQLQYTNRWSSLTSPKRHTSSKSCHHLLTTESLRC